MKTTKRKDRRMIKKFCNWIDKESPVFLEWLDYGFDDVVFLSAHAKRVGIRKKTAWEASRKFLKCRNPKVDEKQLREWFGRYYEFESTMENEREWRQIYFKGKKKPGKMQSFSFTDPDLMKCINPDFPRPCALICV